MSDARANILRRLRAAPAGITQPYSDWSVLRDRDWSIEEQIERFRTMAESVNARVIDCVAPDDASRPLPSWDAVLAEDCAANGVRRLAVSAPLAAPLQALWTGSPHRPDIILTADRDTLFSVDAGLTTARGGIAETGSLILWPGPTEPRMLSLVPPRHIALLRTSRLHPTLWHAMTENGWAGQMPTNVVLATGPSKTSDIEQTLVFGVHGPKDLLILLIYDH